MELENRVASGRCYMESESASTTRVSLPTVSRGRELKFDVGFVFAIPERSLRRRRRRVPYRCGLPRFGDYFRIARHTSATQRSSGDDRPLPNVYNISGFHSSTEVDESDVERHVGNDRAKPSNLRNLCGAAIPAAQFHPPSRA